MFNPMFVRGIVLASFLLFGFLACSESFKYRIYNNTGEIVTMVTCESKNSKQVLLEIFPATYSYLDILDMRSNEETISLSYYLETSKKEVKTSFTAEKDDELEIWLLEDNMLRVMPNNTDEKCSNVKEGCACTYGETFVLNLELSAMAAENPCHRLYRNCNFDVTESCIYNAIETDQCYPMDPPPTDPSDPCYDEDLLNLTHQYPMGYDTTDIILQAVQLKSTTFEALSFEGTGDLEVVYNEDNIDNVTSDVSVGTIDDTKQRNYWYGTGTLLLLGKYQLNNYKQCRTDHPVSLHPNETVFDECDKYIEGTAEVEIFGRTSTREGAKVIDLWLNDLYSGHTVQDKISVKVDWDYSCDPETSVSGVLTLAGSNCPKDGYGVHIRANHSNCNDEQCDSSLDIYSGKACDEAACNNTVDRRGWYFIHDFSASLFPSNG
jgi:hypothetical protein